MVLTDKLQIARDASASGESAEGALTLFDRVKRQEEQIAAALPAGMDAGRFVRMALTEFRRVPKLTQCTPESILGAMMLAAQTGLEPGGPLGQAYLIPRRNKQRGVMEAQFQIGYKGYIQLASRSGITIVARTVRQDDSFDWMYGTEEFIRHKPAVDSTLPAIYWYAIGHYPSGRRPAFVVIDRNVADRARMSSSTPDRGPWKDDYDSMALKTSILRLKNFLPLSTDVALAMATDGAVVIDTTARLEEVAATMTPNALESGDADPELDGDGLSEDEPVYGPGEEPFE